MASVQITCINKLPRDNTHEGITHLGNAQGKWTRAQVIAWIDSKEHDFFTMVGGKRAKIDVVNPPGRSRYVRTHADGVWNDNLLALNECS